MAKSRFYPACAVLFGAFSLTQCAGPVAGPISSDRYVPRVSMPESSRLSSNENRFLPEVEDVLVRAGFRPVQGFAEYRLEMHLEDGPVNADSMLRLLRENSEVANAKARVGGLTTIFRRSRVVEDSFRRCLDDFESQLPRNSPAQEKNDHRIHPERTDIPVQEGADWQRGW